MSSFARRHPCHISEPKEEWEETRDHNKALDNRILARVAAAQQGLDCFGEVQWQVLKKIVGTGARENTNRVTNQQDLSRARHRSPDDRSCGWTNGAETCAVIVGWEIVRGTGLSGELRRKRTPAAHSEIITALRLSQSLVPLEGFTC